MSRKRVGPFSAARGMSGNHSDLAVIVSLIAVSLVAAVSYGLVRGGDDGSAVVTVNQSTNSTPRYTAPPVTKRTTAPQFAVPQDATTSVSPVPESPTTTTTRTTAKGKGKGAKAGGAQSGGQRQLGPATNVRWVASPGTATLAPGGHLSGVVTAKNLSSVPGWVITPGCSSGPSTFAATPFALTCATSGRQVVLPGSRSKSWEWTWNATVSGKKNATPLAPGTYSFMIGPATVSVTVA